MTPEADLDVARLTPSPPVTAPEAVFTAQLIWQQLHGIVSLRISRPGFPWPPLEETVMAAVNRLLGPSPSMIPNGPGSPPQQKRTA